MINPATTQHFDGPSIPSAPQTTPGILALTALAAGMKGWQESKAAKEEMAYKYLAALGPTMIANDQLGSQQRPGGVPVPTGNSGLPLYANAPLSYNDVISSGGNIPAKYADAYSTYKAAQAAPGELADMVQQNSVNPAISGSVKINGAEYKVGDTVNPYDASKSQLLPGGTGQRASASQSQVDFFANKAGRKVNSVTSKRKAAGFTNTTTPPNPDPAFRAKVKSAIRARPETLALWKAQLKQLDAAGDETKYDQLASAIATAEAMENE